MAKIQLKVWGYRCERCKHEWIPRIKINTAKCYQPLLTSGKGIIQIGNNVNFGVKSSPNYYTTYSYLEARRKSSKIIIGDDNYFNNNLAIISDGKTITIGSKCLFGYNVEITDSNFHDLSAEGRFGGHNIIKEDVIIGDNVFLGNNVTILKGVKIGKNSVIGNKSLVNKDIPPNCVATGNPCKVIKYL